MPIAGGIKADIALAERDHSGKCVDKKGMKLVVCLNYTIYTSAEIGTFSHAFDSTSITRCRIYFPLLTIAS